MRVRIRQAVERAILKFPFPGLFRAKGSGPAMILAYHNIVPERTTPKGDISLHLPIDLFRRQLDLLEEYCSVVPLSYLLECSEMAGRPLAAITFDDAYRGAIQLGLPELISRGLPATIFVSPGLLGSPGFWWDLLAKPGGGGLPTGLRKRALQQLAGDQAKILGWASRNGYRLEVMSELFQPARIEEVDSVAQEEEVTLGSHTWSHVHLPSLSSAQARREMRQPLDWLHGTQKSPPYLSYPYGAQNEPIRQLARELGYTFAFGVQGGRLSVPRINGDPYSIPRMNVPRGLTLEGFLLRIRGFSLL